MRRGNEEQKEPNGRSLRATLHHRDTETRRNRPYTSYLCVLRLLVVESLSRHSTVWLLHYRSAPALPDFSFASRIGPIATRRSSVTGCRSLRTCFFTCRLRPPRIVTTRSRGGVCVPVSISMSAGSVRLPAMTMRAPGDPDREHRARRGRAPRTRARRRARYASGERRGRHRS